MSPMLPEIRAGPNLRLTLSSPARKSAQPVYWEPGCHWWPGFVLWIAFGWAGADPAVAVVEDGFQIGSPQNVLRARLIPHRIQERHRLAILIPCIGGIAAESRGGRLEVIDPG